MADGLLIEYYRTDGMQKKTLSRSYLKRSILDLI